MAEPGRPRRVGRRCAHRRAPPRIRSTPIQTVPNAWSRFCHAEGRGFESLHPLHPLYQKGPYFRAFLFCRRARRVDVGRRATSWCYELAVRRDAAARRPDGRPEARRRAEDRAGTPSAFPPSAPAAGPDVRAQIPSIWAGGTPPTYVIANARRASAAIAGKISFIRSSTPPSHRKP